MKLNLGSGAMQGKREAFYSKDEGWINVDMFDYPGVGVVLDFEESDLPFDDNSVEEVHMVDIIEHITGGRQLPILKEVFRVLQHGGKCTIQTPDLGRVCHVYSGLDELRTTSAQEVAQIFNGTQTGAGTYHKWMYDKKGLVDILTDVGFLIEWCEPFGVWFNMACVAWKGEIPNK